MPYRLVGGTRFYQRREIKDALAYLRLVHNPTDNVSLIRIINVPPRNLGEKTVAVLASWSGELGLPMAAGLALLAGDLLSPTLAGRGPALPEDTVARFSKPPEHPFSGAAQRALIAFYRVYAGWLAARDGLTVAALLDKIAEESGYATWLRDGTEEGEDRWNNLQELRSVAANYDGFPPDQRLSAFLEEVALVSDQDELTDDKDRVTLLTLHTAKGLEFPAVFIVGLEENIFPHSRSMEDPDQMEEERRLMYVGVTRAKDRLYLVRAFRRTLYGRAQVNEASRFLQDVKGATQETRDDGRQPTDSYEQRPPTADDQRRSSQRAGTGAGSRQPQFKPGDRVDHGLFGQGIVLKTELTGDDEDVTVVFTGKGTKTLLAGYAKLRKIP
jgi:DNA helicase-2/ATP-dependent DNA helicase PcrA